MLAVHSCCLYVPHLFARDCGWTGAPSFVPRRTFGRVHAPVQEPLYVQPLQVDVFATRLLWNDLDAYMHRITLCASVSSDHQRD
jgi:hypothetical protein